MCLLSGSIVILSYLLAFHSLFRVAEVHSRISILQYTLYYVDQSKNCQHGADHNAS